MIWHPFLSVRTRLLLSLATAVALVAIVIGFQLLRPRPLVPAAPAAGVADEPQGEARATAAITPNPAPAVETEAPPAPPTLPELARHGGRQAGDHRPVEKALTDRSAEELQLGGQLARAGLESPPEMVELFQRRQRGDSLPQLRRFVVDRFPRELKLRALTLDWLERHPAP
jgi:hypothetical protein